MSIIWDGLSVKMFDCIVRLKRKTHLYDNSHTVRCQLDFAPLLPRPVLRAGRLYLWRDPKGRPMPSSGGKQLSVRLARESPQGQVPAAGQAGCPPNAALPATRDSAFDFGIIVGMRSEIQRNQAHLRFMVIRIFSRRYAGVGARNFRPGPRAQAVIPDDFILQRLGAIRRGENFPLGLMSRGQTG